MSLARSVLAVHDGIREVFVLEERPGQYVVVDEAKRDGGVSLLLESMHDVRRHAYLIPAAILGAAAQFTGEPNSLRLVGILYGKGGVILTRLNETKLLALSTTPEHLYSVMEKLHGALPALLERELGGKAGGVKSAAEAESLVRSYLAGKVLGSTFVDEVSHRGADHRWLVHGSCRPSRWAYSKRFQVELDADNGSIMRFATTPAVRGRGIYFFLAEFTCLLATALALAWLLQHTLWR
jgi:hypothetical protein